MIRTDRTLIIAEVASSHEGRPDLACKIARAAAAAGADAVKFQIFRPEELVVRHHPKVESFHQINLAPSAWTEVVEASREEGLHVLADVYDLASLDLGEDLGIEGYKISTTVWGDSLLLRSIANTRKPVFLAVAGEAEEEIRGLLELLGDRSDKNLVLLHGFQAFPTQLEDIHVRRLTWLQEHFRFPVGFADHCPATLSVASVLPVVAVALGARVIEKHLTWDRSAKGRDHVSALNPPEFAQMVQWIREVESALGEARPNLMQPEIYYRATMQKKVVARVAIPAGNVLKRRHLALKRTPDAGLGGERIPEIVGKKLLRAIDEDGAINPQDVAEPVAVVLVAVRMKSRRLPDKALLPLSGKPVLAHLVERVSRARIPRAVVICTSTHPEDKTILEWASRLGVRAYAGSEDDVLDRFLKAAEVESADLVVRVTGDNPVTDPEAIDAMIQLHRAEGADYTYTEDLPRGTRPEVISVTALRKAHELAEDPLSSEYMTLYFKEHPEHFDLTRWEVPSIGLRRPHYRLTLDTPEDLALLQRVYAALYREGEIFPLADVIHLLDTYPNWVSLNAHIAPKVPVGTNTRLRSCP